MQTLFDEGWELWKEFKKGILIRGSRLSNFRSL